MKRLVIVGLMAAMLAVGAVVALAETTGGDSSTTSVTFNEIAVLSASGAVPLLTIVAPASAGDLPADDSDASTDMAWTSNVASGTRKITGSLATLYSGIDLYATVAAPTGASGTSASEQKFTTADTAVDFVTGIGNCNVSAQTITIRADVTAMVAPYTTTSYTITWTITAAA